VVRSIKEEDCGSTSQYKKLKCISKITRAEKARAIAQVVECPCSIHEVLNSNPTGAKRLYVFISFSIVGLFYF
jgi:hypothetical protein